MCKPDPVGLIGGVQKVKCLPNCYDLSLFTDGVPPETKGPLLIQQEHTRSPIITYTANILTVLNILQP